MFSKISFCRYNLRLRTNGNWENVYNGRYAINFFLRLMHASGFYLLLARKSCVSQVFQAVFQASAYVVLYFDNSCCMHNLFSCILVYLPYIFAIQMTAIFPHCSSILVNTLRAFFRLADKVTASLKRYSLKTNHIYIVAIIN